MVLYDIPGRSGIQITYDTILRAAKHPNIVAVKDAKGDLAEVSRVMMPTFCPPWLLGEPGSLV
jgi:4-hydroxy-tetrahydrodipicolinate synthase